MPGDPNITNPSFRHTQYRDGSSPTIGLYEAIIALTLDHLNNINIVKHRDETPQHNISIDKTVEIMMDMLCRMMYKGRMDLFQEGMKIKLIESINEILKGGQTDENTVQRKSDRDGPELHRE